MFDNHIQCYWLLIVFWPAAHWLNPGSAIHQLTVWCHVIWFHPYACKCEAAEVYFWLNVQNKQIFFSYDLTTSWIFQPGMKSHKNCIFLPKKHCRLLLQLSIIPLFQVSSVSETFQLHTECFIMQHQSSGSFRGRLVWCGVLLWDIFSKWESGVSNNKT